MGLAAGTSVVRGEWRPLGAERYELGEGARFLGGRLYFVDLLAGRLLRADPRGEDAPVQLVGLDVPLGAVALLAGGGTGERPALLGAVGTGVARLEDGAPSWIARPAAGGPVVLRVNDAATDPAGRFWFTSMAWDQEEDAGAVYRLDPDGRVTTVLAPYTVPNGPAFSADGRTMWLADSARSTIHRFPADPATGELGEQEVFAEVDGTPDGMTVDADGFLWSAIHGSSCLHRYHPSGELVERVPLPARQPTSIAISVEPPYLLVVTTATEGLDEPGDHDGRTLVTDVAVGGLSQPLARA